MADSAADPTADSVPAMTPVVPEPIPDPSPIQENANFNGHAKPVAKVDAVASSSKKTVSSKSALSPSNVDAVIEHVTRCIRARRGAETILNNAAYSTRMLAAILQAFGRIAARYQAHKLIQLFYKLPPSATVLLSSTKPPPIASISIELSKRLFNLVGMLGEWRTMNRMWGWLATYSEVKGILAELRSRPDSEKIPQSSRFNNSVKIAGLTFTFGYQVCEALSFLINKRVVPGSPDDGKRFSIWGSRSWGVSVFLELFRLLVERQRRAKSDDKEVEAAYKHQWFMAFTRELAWAPLTIHWSMENGGFVPEFFIGLLGIHPASGSMQQVWSQSA